MQTDNYEVNSSMETVRGDFLVAPQWWYNFGQCKSYRGTQWQEAMWEMIAECIAQSPVQHLHLQTVLDHQVAHCVLPPEKAQKHTWSMLPFVCVNTVATLTASLSQHACRCCMLHAILYYGILHLRWSFSIIWILSLLWSSGGCRCHYPPCTSEKARRWVPCAHFRIWGGPSHGWSPSLWPFILNA